MIGNYTSREMMAIMAGRLIRNGDILFAGTGIATLAAVTAKKIHAPQAVIFFETGGIDPSLAELPISVADLRVMIGSSLNAGLIDAFSILANRKLRTIAFLGAAQIDQFGNINSTSLGNYRRPRLRFPGSGGACDAASMASETIIFMQHEKKKFVEKLDYLTSPGWLDGGESRREHGLDRGGPMAVVTHLGLLRFKEDTREMYLAETYPGIPVEEVQANTGFVLDVSRTTESLPPSEEELRILRQEVDPRRIILG